MRHPIDTAPRDGEFVIIVDEASGHFDVAKWSTSQEWVRENGEPAKFRPSHWNRIGGGPFEGPPRLGGHPNNDAPPLEPPKSVALRHPEKASGAHAEVSFPSAAKLVSENMVPALEDRQVLVAPVEKPIGAIDQQLRSTRRWRFAASCAVVLIAATGLSLYWHAGTAARSISDGSALRVVEEHIQLGTQAMRNVGQWVQRSPTQPDHATRTAVVGEFRQAQAPAPAEDTSSASTRQLEEINKRLEMLLSELGEVHRTNDALNAQLRAETARAQSLEQERDKASVLAQQTAENRQELVASAERSRSALEAEQARVAALTGELASVRRDLEAKTAAASKAADEVRQTADATTSELRQSLHQERDRSAGLARDLAAAQRVIESRAEAERVAKNQAVAAAPARELTTEGPAEAKATPTGATLIDRARALIAQGDIGAARIVLESAAEAGNAKASFALAETYDPNILARWGTYGTRSDASKARELYGKATAGGIQEAKDRINALRQ